MSVPSDADGEHLRYMLGAKSNEPAAHPGDDTGKPRYPLACSARAGLWR